MILFWGFWGGCFLWGLFWVFLISFVSLLGRFLTNILFLSPDSFSVLFLNDVIFVLNFVMYVIYGS